MKMIRMGLMAFAALTGIGSAFAFSPKSNATTYYARKTVTGFHWVTGHPNPNTSTCQPAAKGACTISTTNAPVDDVIPAGHADVKMLYQPI